jgi:hypothetical protein
MINREENYLGWARLMTDLDDAREHLEKLANEMNQAGAIGDEEFAVQLGHVYAHLNRVWHSRNQREEITDEQWPFFSQFPKDLEPIG